MAVPTAKLAPKQQGPFKIIKQILPVAYQLQLPRGWTIHDIFHMLLLLAVEVGLEPIVVKGWVASFYLFVKCHLWGVWHDTFLVSQVHVLTQLVPMSCHMRGTLSI